jgi:RimJ/RimL family protein N-acetyltransferase
VTLSREGVRLFPVAQRYAWPGELDLMARIAGLRLKERWAGWNREPVAASRATWCLSTGARPAFVGEESFVHRSRGKEHRVASRGAYRTERLRLVPIGTRHAAELWELHQDEGIARWHAGRWSTEQALRFAAAMGRSWRERGFGKWLAYENSTGALVGRGGLSMAVVEGEERVEVGWALRQATWGRGYATELGRAGLALAFFILGVELVVSFTEVHNARSRAVMERLGMRYARQILRPGLIAGSSEVHEAAPFALYRITRTAHPGE